MRDNNELLGYIIYSFEYEFILPFRCRKCGNCCDPIPNNVAYDLEQIAENLGVSKEELFLDKFSEIAEIYEENGERWFRELPAFKNSPCPFLSANRQCEIYPSRSDGCKLFPIKTDFGSGGINCLGYKEVKRAKDKLRKESILISSSSNLKRARENRTPNSGELIVIIDILKKAKYSIKTIAMFLNINNIAENF